MKSYIALFAAGLAALPAVAGYEYLDVVPLEARQATGEKFACHENCGNAILGGKEEDTHCDNSTWLGFLEECLNCAEEFDIWQHYGNGVTEAADACELDATPVDAEESSGTETTDNEASPTADADETEESSDAEEESGDGDSAASSMTSSASMMLFAMIAAAGLL